MRGGRSRETSATERISGDHQELHDRVDAEHDDTGPASKLVLKEHAAADEHLRYAETELVLWTKKWALPVRSARSYLCPWTQVNPNHLGRAGADRTAGLMLFHRQRGEDRQASAPIVVSAYMATARASPARTSEA